MGKPAYADNTRVNLILSYGKVKPYWLNKLCPDLGIWLRKSSGVKLCNNNHFWGQFAIACTRNNVIVSWFDSNAGYYLLTFKLNNHGRRYQWVLAMVGWIRPVAVGWFIINPLKMSRIAVLKAEGSLYDWGGKICASLFIFYLCKWKSSLTVHLTPLF